MVSEQNCLKLADQIRSILRQGVIADNGIRQFIVSVFCDPSPAELDKILHDEADSNRDSLIDLIFTPDEPMQCRLEPLLETELFSPEDEKRVIRQIGMYPLESGLLLSKDAAKIKIPMTLDMITTFVSRLKITRQLPSKLVGIINQHPDSATALIIKVRLRHSRLLFTPEIVEFLNQFLNCRLPSGRFFHYLNFVISFLESKPARQSVICALQAQREQYMNHIDLAVRFESMLNHDNMETLMLQGRRAPYISKMETLANIAIIDDICYALGTQSL